MISNNTELYAVIRSISADLRAAHESSWAAAIDDALTISSLPGEIFGETRFQLRRLRADPVAERLGLIERIDEAVAVLDAALGGR